MKQALLAAAVIAVAMVPAGLLLEAQTQNRPLDPLVIAWDSGPDKIDVSKYPPDIKKKYKTFQELCSRCHPLARAVNCDFALEDDWERYIKRMMRRGGKLISPEEAQDIFDFAMYDSKTRKRELYDRKMAALR